MSLPHFIRRCWLHLTWRLPSPYRYLCRAWFWMKGIRYDEGLDCDGALPQVFVHPKAREASVGRNFKAYSYRDVAWYCKCSFTVLEGATFRVGDDSGMNGVMVFCMREVTIGSHVKIGGGTRIIDTDFHCVDWQKRRDAIQDQAAKCAPVHIGDDVFIGMGCMILRGVTIGPRTIIAAGSVVTHDIPADVLAGGSPCRVIRATLPRQNSVMP